MDNSDRARSWPVRGLVIVAALLAGALLIFYLDEIIAGTRGRYELVAVFDAAPEVASGTPVWIAGRDIGTVTSVSLAPVDEGPVKVIARLRLYNEARPYVRRDSDLDLARGRPLLGEAIVRISAGTAAAPALQPGDTLRETRRTEAVSLLRSGAALPARLDSLLTTAAEVRRLAADRGGRLDHLLLQLERTQRQLSVFAADFDRGSLGRFLADPELAGRVASLRRTVDELAAVTQQALERYRAGPAGTNGLSPSPLVGHLERLERRAGALQAELDLLEHKLEEGPGFLPRVQRDSAIDVAVRRTRAQIDSLLAEVRANPLRAFW